MLKLKLHLLLLSFTAMQLNAQTKQHPKQVKTIIVFFDGLRPDYISPELMPNLYQFKREGCYGNRHHSVFPTVTRVNASSYATGSYPEKNGIMGNTVYFPEVDSLKGLNTGDATALLKIADATHGHLLTAISIGEILQENGEKMMVFSSGSSGQAFMQNHKASGGAIVNTSLILPESFKETVIGDLGEIPPHAKPNSAQHQWVADALIRYALQPDGPLVSAIWFSDPDGTAHSDGIGVPSTNAAIKSVDEQFGRLLKALKDKGLTDQYNIIISADHGFVTDIGKQGLAEFLIQKGLKKSRDSEDVIVAEGAIYVKNHEETLIKNIVKALQQEAWVGPIFTKANSKDPMLGTMAGTLSFDAIHWNHVGRRADILVDENWNDDANTNGYKGTSFSRGVAGHGGFSPYEVHIPLIASGPSFKKAWVSDFPTSNVDIVPTILYLNHIPVPKQMEGRVLYELLNQTPPSSFKPKVEVKNVETSVKFPGGSYRLILQKSNLGDYSYNDFAKVIRE